MKKRIFLAVLLVAVLAFGAISCKKEDKNEPKEEPKEDVARCWKISIVASAGGVSDSLTVYYWNTEASVNAILSSLESSAEYTSKKATVEAAGGTVSLVKEEAAQYTTQASCEAQNTQN